MLIFVLLVCGCKQFCVCCLLFRGSWECHIGHPLSCRFLFLFFVSPISPYVWPCFHSCLLMDIFFHNGCFLLLWFSLFQKDQFYTLELVIQPGGISDFPIRYSFILHLFFFSRSPFLMHLTCFSSDDVPSKQYWAFIWLTDGFLSWVSSWNSKWQYRQLTTDKVW